LRASLRVRLALQRARASRFRVAPAQAQLRPSVQASLPETRPVRRPPASRVLLRASRALPLRASRALPLQASQARPEQRAPRLRALQARPQQGARELRASQARPEQRALQLLASQARQVQPAPSVLPVLPALREPESSELARESARARAIRS
jgi:hypothetical protein